MAGMAVGLITGMDTTSMISQLMQLEARPQAQLRARVTSTNAQVSAYQSVNTRLASALAAAKKLADDATWTPAKVSSSTTSITTTTTPGAVNGAVTFDVTALAAAQFTATGVVGATDSVVEAGVTSIVLTQGGKDTTITVGGTDVASVAAAINDAKTGVRATALQVSDGQYRLQLTSTATGTASAFTVTGITGYDTIKQAGTDAQISLGSGLTMTSSDGRFVDVMPGTTFSVTKLETGATVTVSNDAAATTAAVKALVDNVNTALQEITSRTRSKNPADATSVAGALAGDSLLRGITQSVLSAMTTGDASPAEAGLQTTREGLYTFDATKFEALLASDPAKARELVSAVATTLSAVTSAASDPTKGTVTTAVTRRQDSVKELTTQVENWDVRLALRRSTLERQYSAMESALGRLQSQSGWLAGQLGSLPRWE